MKLLLHTCCGPCLIYPLKRVREKGFEPEIYYFNPNIYPFVEFVRRKEALEKLRQSTDFKVIYPEYDAAEFNLAIAETPQSPQRCYNCWALRLRRSAQFAKDNKFDSFSTTLLVSPFQDHNALKEIGDKVARDEGIEFYYEDFREGYRTARQEAKEKGIYCQKYCGCTYSKEKQYSNGRD